MKKSFLLYSSIAVSLLLILISCTKESTSNPYVTEISHHYADTPYKATFDIVDTPYLGTFHVLDTPYLKTYHVSSSFVDKAYFNNHGK